ncbi:PGPGW domain-containing protein [Mycobacterium sp. MYCO198283]|uniref:PGPGW domain-containing protein n=1 Tax=Mycobacterium sp. MYCO198283 TaxID=2883505 RepID=UPI001E554704|nr:PGPGW domain-containing protein [Mycobacterium sp. MYCO198283]MCG5433679.1 PGPGW domain-containing protein [Mycobacterium sp. MYCO198283]
MTDSARRWARWRDGLRDRPVANGSYRAGVAVVGVVVTAGGISFAPLYLVGLGILASEFAWARRLLGPVRRRYERVAAWFDRQGWWVRAAATAVGVALVLAALWLAGVAGLAAQWLGVEQPWLRTPLPVGR